MARNKAKQAEKLIDARIERAYRAKCCGIQINIMDIGKVFAEGRKAIAEGKSDEALADDIHAFVLKIAA